MKRVAIAGAGAVAREYYLPALIARERAGMLRVIGVFDPDQDAATGLASRLTSARPASILDALLESGPDLLIVASPPAFHAQQTIRAITAGSAVLCEKPLALSSEDAARMTAAARDQDRALGVALVRRSYPSTALMRAALEDRMLGEPLRVEAFGGGKFTWPIAGQDYFNRGVSGGGVLADLGPHLLDLTRHWLGSLELMSMEDDAMGGVEANCIVQLDAAGVPITIRLSRDWPRPNVVRVTCTRGALVWHAEELGRIEIERNGSSYWLTTEDASDFEQCFARHVDAVLAGRPLVSGEEAAETVALIERAYVQRQAMSMPWLRVHHGR